MRVEPHHKDVDKDTERFIGCLQSATIFGQRSGGWKIPRRRGTIQLVDQNPKMCLGSEIKLF